MSKIIFSDNWLRYGIIFILLHIIFSTQAQTENNVHLKNEIWLDFPVSSLRYPDQLSYPSITYKRALSQRSYLKAGISASERKIRQNTKQTGDLSTDHSGFSRGFGFDIGYERRKILNERLSFFYGPEAGLVHYNDNNSSSHSEHSTHTVFKRHSYYAGISGGVLFNLGKHISTALSYGYFCYINEISIRENTNDVIKNSKSSSMTFDNTPIMISAILKF